MGGHHELAGTRQRYRVLKLGRLLRCLGHAEDDIGGFRGWYQATLSADLAAGRLAREPHWSEAFAVGDRDWLGDVYRAFGFKRKQVRAVAQYGMEVPDPGGLAEAAACYIKG